VHADVPRMARHYWETYIASQSELRKDPRQCAFPEENVYRRVVVGKLRFGGGSSSGFWLCLNNHTSGRGESREERCVRSEPGLLLASRTTIGGRGEGGVSVTSASVRVFAKIVL